MKGTLVATLVLGGTMAFLGGSPMARADPATPTGRQTGPITLTDRQMDGVVAGGWGQGLNLNITTQVAVPVSVGFAVCVICPGGSVSAFVSSIGNNFSFGFQQ